MTEQKTDAQEFQKSWGKVVAKAWSDKAFKARLLVDPAAVLKEHGVKVPADVAIKVVEDSARVSHLILPPPPEELSDESLQQLAAGVIPVPLPRWRRAGLIPEQDRKR
jgi:hypothetical protein